jgi:hypothetical protein
LRGVRPWLRQAGPLALFAVLAVVHTWPLATAPATLSRNDNADTILNEWILAWVAHQLPRAPLRLFHANIFYPEPNTLAFSEHMVVQSVMGLPLFWLGASPVLVYNLLLLAGFTLTAWAMYLGIAHATGDTLAGLLAGSLAAFNAHVFTRLPHLQALHVEFLPLAVLALHRLLDRPSAWTAAALGLLFALQGLTSNYWLAFISLSFVAAVLMRPAEWTGTRLPSAMPMLALAVAIALVLVVPFLLPYSSVMRRQGFVRGLDEIAAYSATWRDYLSTTGRLHWNLWSKHVWAMEGLRAALFPGVIATALAAVAVASGVAWRDRHARLWLAIGAAAVVFSFGTAVPGYATLWEIFPLLKGVRAPVRMGHLALIAIAALAGFGVAYLRRRFGAGRRWATAGALAMLAGVHVEAIRAPMGYVPASLPAEEYKVLAAERRAVVVEFPFYVHRQFFGNAQYMLNSTRHWRPLVNGYSGFVPASYAVRYGELQGFPDERSLRALRDLFVTHAVVHHVPSQLGAAMPPLAPHPALDPIARSHALTIYRLRWERIPGVR